MDIKSLLSAPDASESSSNGVSSQSQPSSSQKSTAGSPQTSPPRTRRKQQSLVHQALATSTAQHLQSLQDSSSDSLVTTTPSRPPQPLGRNAYSTTAVTSRAQYSQPSPASQPPLVQRHSSSSMDTLADLATMQHYHHTARQNSISSRNPELVSPQHSPSVSASRLHSEPPTPATPSALRKGSVVEHPMAEGPVAVIQQRTFDAPSLSKSELATVADLTKQLSDNSFLYTSHVQLIDILHRGLISHSFPPDGSSNDPTTYPLLQDLRQARSAMDSRFACGEDIWLVWLQDEVMLARSTDDRIAVMELCQRAVQEEVGSAPLWRLYGDWMFILHQTAFDLNSDYQANSLESHEIVGAALQSFPWSDQDKMVGREVFAWDHMLSVWQQGVSATSWHIPDSNLVWDAHMEILLSELRARSSPEKVNHIRQLFWDRLRQPHLSWDDTFQTFSQFVSAFDSAAYEETMVTTKQKCQKTLQAVDDRRGVESKLQRAIAVGDKDAEWTVMSEYLEREFAAHRQKHAPHFSYNMLESLCQRCTLRFPTDANFWEDYTDLLAEQSNNLNSIVPVAYRATRHVPWAGNLWSKRINILEATNKSFEEVEGVKHMATSTGLLEEIGSMDELIKVYSTWCGYLRRRAFSSKSGEDERDVAEVAIRSAIENIKEVGLKRYGKDFKGDPRFRIERIYFKFMAQTGAFDEARKFWAELTVTHGDQYEFWDRYYLWEMVVWPLEYPGLQQDVRLKAPPHHATAVLQRAIARPNLDWPEKMIEQYQHHCSQHESVDKMLEAQVEARRRMKDMERRRAAQAAEAEKAQQQQHATTTAAYQEQTGALQDNFSIQDGSAAAGKRKRSDAQMLDNAEPKRLKSESAEDQSPLGGQPAELKRDREHTTVVVKHLPRNVEDGRIRSFFHDCGRILSLVVSHGASDSTATVEFESQEDVLTAKTKSMKPFDGHEIEIQVGSSTTLYVANYPPEADEKYIRNLFGPYGEIVDVRFPSLRFNTHRRFCYVQFTNSTQALAATELDGKAVGKGLKLTAKISDPSKKQDRSGATEEGRECFVGQFDYSATEADARTLFEKYGSIESVRIPRNMNGGSKGIAFVVFAAKEEAEAATEMNLKGFKGRILQVKLSNSKEKSVKSQSKTVVQPSAPADPEHLPDAENNKASGKDYRQRSVALLNVPDTVNDARIRALCEPHGEIKKIVLRPDHQGAIVEFGQVADVGKASMALDGIELAPGRNLRIGEVHELFKQGADTKPVKQTTSKPASFAPMAPISRPGQSSARRGGKLGMSSRRPGAASSTGTVPARDEHADTNGQQDGDANAADGSGAGKTQDDFRAMLAGPKPQ